MKVLYLSFDGLLEPLGYSQVVRLVRGLSRRGIRYVVCSLERSSDLARPGAVSELEAELAKDGIPAWERLTYHQSGTSASAVRNLLGAATTVVRRRAGFDVLHARSYHAASVASLTQWPGRRPHLLFDTRAFWFDERREQGRWFANDRVYEGALRFERHLIERSAGIVTLTELAARDLREGRRGSIAADVPVEAIPTVVDFEAFHLRKRAAARRALQARFTTLGTGPVFGFVGSVNSWYAVDEALDLFVEVYHRLPTARFLGLSAAHEELDRRLVARAIPEQARFCTRANHADMPAWVSAIDWGFLLLGESEAKRASMPTKLGEFFAAGVRPIHFGCNAEVGEWVKRTGSGLSLSDLSADTLRNTAGALVGAPRDPEDLLRAREIARPHFSLESAVDRYEILLKRIARV